MLLNEFLLEIKQSKKVYSLHLLSFLAAMSVFLLIPELEKYIGIDSALTIVFIWLGINSLGILIYHLKSYIELLFNVEAQGNIEKRMIWKIILFSLFFGLNTFLFAFGNSIIVPVVALGGNFLVLLFAKSFISNRKALIFLGLIWFCALYVLTYGVYRTSVLLIYMFTSSKWTSEILSNIILFIIAYVIFVFIHKQVKKK